jgi:hypothetical protein
MSSTQNGGSPGVGSGWIIPAWICRILVGIPITGALLVLIASAFVGLPRVYNSVMPDDKGLLPAAKTEEASAFREDQAIHRVAEMCVAAGKQADGNAGGSQLQASSVLNVNYPSMDQIKVRENPPLRELPGYLDAETHLSEDLVSARTQLAGKVVIDELISELFEWSLVATGLFTTILISVKAFASPRSNGYLSMAIMAIVLSSLGTAVATLNSFYTPRIAYEKTQHSLASLRSLHWTLAGEVLRAQNPCEDKGSWNDWRPRHVRDLTNSFVAIMIASMNATAAPNSPDDRPDPAPAPKSQDQGKSPTPR